MYSLLLIGLLTLFCGAYIFVSFYLKLCDNFVLRFLLVIILSLPIFFFVLPSTVNQSQLFMLLSFSFQTFGLSIYFGYYVVFSIFIKDILFFLFYQKMILIGNFQFYMLVTFWYFYTFLESVLRNIHPNNKFTTFIIQVFLVFQICFLISGDVYCL